MKPNTNMLVMEPTGNAKGTIRALKLKRETLRELGAGALMQASPGLAPRTLFCEPTDGCTRKRCDTRKC